MTDTPELHGKCLCGAVGVTIAPPETHIDACHCGMCRRWSGGPHLGLGMVSDPVFTGAEHVVRYASSEWAERGFCGTCGTHLFYRFVPTGNYSFLAGMFDGADDFALTLEIFVDNKPGYYDFAGERERLTEAETMAKFAAAFDGGQG